MFEGMIVMGENLNATRKVKVGGKNTVDLPNGKTGYAYKGADGQTKYLDLTEAIKTEQVKAKGMVGHIATGVINQDEEFITAMATVQINAGADYLDCCVDEITSESAGRIKHMQWLVQALQRNVRVPLSIDSSDPLAIEGGLEVYDWSVGRPILNSVNLEEPRLPTLKLAQQAKAQILGNASGRTSLPDSVESRMKNLIELMELMDKYEIPMADRSIDPLLMTICTNQEHGNHFLETCRQMRAKYGPEFHMTGGLSNVGFGLPNRRLINEAMTYLARESGCDLAFVDPLQIKSFRPDDEDFKVTVDMLIGNDPFCMMYVTYFREHGAKA